MPLEPLHYAPPAESPSARHNRIYTTLLIVLAAFFSLGMIGMFFMSRNPAVPAESRWVFQMSLCIYAALVAGMVVILILRGTAPGAGRIATKALNIVLLVVFPFGTALGIYGLMKVDKDGPPAGGAA
jgi:hypothetical protein